MRRRRRLASGQLEVRACSNFHWLEVSEGEGNDDTNLEIQPDSPERPVRMPDGEFETEALCYEELEVEDVSRGRLWYVRGVSFERYWVVGRFCSKKEGS